MQLYLRENLVKANGDAGAPAPPAPAGGPDVGGLPAANTQPCSVGGGDMCLQAGGNGANDHKVGGAIERKHSDWQASQGAGAPQVETAAPESAMSPEQAQEKRSQHAEAAATLDPRGTQGTISTKSDDYPDDSHPLDHYRVAEATEAAGGGNDSSKEIAEGHRKIARERAEKMSPEEHEELSAQLREHDLHDDADHHEKTAGEARALQEEKVGEEFDTMMEETTGVEEELAQKEETERAVEQVGKDVESDAARKKQLKEDDPHAHATEEWEAGKVKAEEKHVKSTEKFKAGVDKKHAKATEAHEKKTKAAEAKHEKAVESHKKGVDKAHDKATKEWEKKDKEAKAWEDLAEDHKQREPEKPVPPGPKPAGDLTTASGQKALEDHKTAVKDHAVDKAKHKSQKEAHSAEKVALRKQKPKAHGKKPKHPGHKKGAPKKPTKAAAPKHPGYKTGAPEKPEHKEAPKAEDFDMKKPASAAEKAAHTDYTSQAKTSRENIQSHLEKNPDLSDEEREKLTSAHEALGAHAEAERIPTKEQSAEAKKMGQVAGKHGKEGYQSPEDKAAAKQVDKDKATAAEPAEESRAPETDIEKIQHADHKAKASQMRDNIQSHLDAIQKDPNLSPEQRQSQVDRLQQIHTTLEAHTELEHLPTSEQAGEMKELTKLAAEHGKQPYEAEAAPEGKTKTAAEPKGRSVDWAAKFGRAARAGSAVARAAQGPESAGQLAPQALGAAAGGVMQTGENLLHKPAARAMEQRRRQSALDEKAAASASKKSAKAATKEAIVKGLYLDLDADLDLIKAVTSPNAGTVTESGKRAQRKIKESYAKTPVGVMGGAGIAMVDDPDVGAKWHHDEDDSVEAELEEEVRNQDKDEEEEDTNKAMAMSILKSLQGAAAADVARFRHNDSEVVFMRDVLGYNESDIRKGLASITGRNRHRFHEWMLNRMYTSVDSMMGSMNLV